MKKNVFIFFSLFSCAIFSQKKFSKEIKFVNDNDLYTSVQKDRYYTNGIFLSYRYIQQSNNNKVIKKIYNFELAHKMYTPYKAAVKTKEEHDRPFAGHFYGSFGVDYFLKNNTIFKPEIQIGVIGRNAFGKELQNFIHNIYGFEETVGWKYQIEDALAINLNASYIKNLWTDKTNTIDFNWYNSAKLGTVHTSATIGFYSRIGFKPFQSILNSIAFGGNLNDKNSNYNRTSEVFFYLKPTISYVLYDATIQGSFLNKNSAVTYDIKNVQFQGEFGLQFTTNRFNLGYSVHFYSKKLKSIRVPNTIFYGTINVSYLLN